MISLPLADIAVESRHRTDLGDIAELAESIRAVGLLQPVVVTPDGRLVAGERRLAAVRSLGWTTVPVVTARNLTDAAALLRAESDENTCRKAFTPTEAESIAAAREALLKPLAKERQGRPGEPRSANLAERAPEPRPREASVLGTGFARETIRKVRETKQIAAAPETPEPVRAVAKQALAEMDATGRVDGAYQRVKAAAVPHDAGRRRKPLPEDYRSRVSDLTKTTTSLMSLLEDDRYSPNRASLSASYASDLIRAEIRLAAVLDSLDVNAIRPTSSEARQWWLASLDQITETFQRLRQTL